MKTTDKPFGEAVRQLLEERDWSIRELSRRMKKETGFGSSAYIHFIMRGEMPVTEPVMENAAKVMRVPPATFAEYRLLKAREALDPSVVGLNRALKNLRKYEGG